MSWLKKSLSKILPQIIASLFLAGFVVYAWTEPSVVPPVGNVDAPINVGNTSQYKSGAFGLGGGAGQTLQWLKNIAGTLQIQNSAGTPNVVIDQDGKVGIGTINPEVKLDVQGGDAKVGTVTIKGDGSISTDLNADKLDNLDSTELGKTGLYGKVDLYYSNLPGFSCGALSSCYPFYCNAQFPGQCAVFGNYLCSSGAQPPYYGPACPAGYIPVPLNNWTLPCPDYGAYTLSYSCYKQ